MTYREYNREPDSVKGRVSRHLRTRPTAEAFRVRSTRWDWAAREGLGLESRRERGYKEMCPAQTLTCIAVFLQRNQISHFPFLRFLRCF